MPTETEAPRATLSKATSLLFHIAARSHTLAEFFGVETKALDDATPLKFYAVHRPWLDAHPKDKTQLTFNPDRFAQKLPACSDGQRHMLLFILNVWNESYARSQGWQFDLFRSLSTLDEGNRVAIAWWLECPIWP